MQLFSQGCDTNGDGYCRLGLSNNNDGQQLCLSVPGGTINPGTTAISRGTCDLIGSSLDQYYRFTNTGLLRSKKDPTKCITYNADKQLILDSCANASKNQFKYTTDRNDKNMNIYGYNQHIYATTNLNSVYFLNNSYLTGSGSDQKSTAFVWDSTNNNFKAGAQKDAINSLYYISQVDCGKFDNDPSLCRLNVNNVGCMGANSRTSTGYANQGSSINKYLCDGGADQFFRVYTDPDTKITNIIAAHDVSQPNKLCLGMKDNTIIFDRCSTDTGTPYPNLISWSTAYLSTYYYSPLASFNKSVVASDGSVNKITDYGVLGFQLDAGSGSGIGKYYAMEPNDPSFFGTYNSIPYNQASFINCKDGGYCQININGYNELAGSSCLSASNRNTDGTPKSDSPTWNATCLGGKDQFFKFNNGQFINQGDTSLCLYPEYNSTDNSYHITYSSKGCVADTWRLSTSITDPTVNPYSAYNAAQKINSTTTIKSSYLYDSVNTNGITDPDSGKSDHNMLGYNNGPKFTMYDPNNAFVQSLSQVDCGLVQGGLTTAGGTVDLSYCKLNVNNAGCLAADQKDSYGYPKDGANAISIPCDHTLNGTNGGGVDQFFRYYSGKLISTNPSNPLCLSQNTDSNGNITLKYLDCSNSNVINWATASSSTDSIANPFYSYLQKEATNAVTTLSNVYIYDQNGTIGQFGDKPVIAYDSTKTSFYVTDPGSF